MTTTTTPAAETVDEPQAGSGLFDADGHVIEDPMAIVAKMPEKWRIGREKMLASELAQLHGMSIFPPLGYLSTIPTAGKSIAGKRSPLESGRDTESWLYFLEKVGIERTVLYPTLGLTVGRVRDVEYARVVTRAYNDWIHETYVSHPSGRFQAAGLVPLQDPAATVAELRRLSGELGIRAAVLPAHGLPNHLGSEQFFPVYEAAEELGMALSCHGGAHDGFGFDDFNVFAAVHALGFPFGLLISLAGMLFNNVFERFPGLRVAFLEGGAAWILMAAERFSESFGATPGLSDDILHLPDGTSVKDYLSELMKAGRVVIGCEGGEHQLTNAIEYFGCAPFMYSSDFPHEVNIDSCLHELEELDELPIDDAAKRGLRGEVARAFYRL